MPEIITRAEAKARGLKRYFTALPCPHGHIAERDSRKSTCVECHRARCRVSALKFYYREHEKNKKRAREKARARLLLDADLQQRIANIKAGEKNRSEAKMRGEKHYLGVLCPTGHAVRWTSNGRCVICNNFDFYVRKRRFVIRECGVCDMPFHPKNNGVSKTCSAACQRSWRQAAAKINNPKNYFNGPPNPKGEKQWLRKNQVMLRNLKRVLKDPKAGLPSGLTREFQT